MSVEQLGFLGNNGFIKSLGCASKLLETDALNLVTDLFEKEYGYLMRSVFEKKQDQSAVVEFKERIAALDLMRKKIQDAPIDKIKGFLSSGSNGLIDSINKDVAGVIDNKMDVKIDEEFIQDGFTEEFFNKRLGYKIIGIRDRIFGRKLDVGLGSNEFLDIRHSIAKNFNKVLYFKLVGVKNGTFKRIIPNINKTAHLSFTVSSMSDFIRDGLVSISGPDSSYFHCKVLENLMSNGWTVYVCFCKNVRSFLCGDGSFYFHPNVGNKYIMISGYNVTDDFGRSFPPKHNNSNLVMFSRAEVYDASGKILIDSSQCAKMYFNFSGGGNFAYGRSIERDYVERMHPGILDRSDIFLCKVSTL